MSVRAVSPNEERAVEKLLQTCKEIAWVSGLHGKLAMESAYYLWLKERQIKVIYALDFDVMYSYLFPRCTNAVYARAVEYVLDNLVEGFTLPVGTAAMLLDKAPELFSDAKAKMGERLLKTSLKSQIGMPLRKNESKYAVEQLMNQADAILEKAAYSQSTDVFAQRRLFKLFSEGRYTPYLDLFNNPVDALGDVVLRDPLRHELVRLEKWQTGCRPVNADAVNLTGVCRYMLDSYCSPISDHSRPYLVLLTATPEYRKPRVDALLDDLKFLPDRLEFADGVSRMLIRTPVTMTCFEGLYTAAIQDTKYKSMMKLSDISPVNKVFGMAGSFVRLSTYAGEVDMALSMYKRKCSKQGAKIATLYRSRMDTMLKKLQRETFELLGKGWTVPRKTDTLLGSIGGGGFELDRA